MKMYLANGLELNPIIVMGGQRYVQGTDRDVLTFIFDETVSMDQVDSLFTEANCESMILVDAETNEEFIHKGYVLRVELIKKEEELEPATSESDAVMVKRVQVSMAQRTYAETKIAQMSQEIIDTQLAVTEIAELSLGGTV